MPTLNSVFIKPVDRPIEGVIKADDEASLRLEIDEYVLTNEVAKRLEAFLDGYNNYEGANGVWISGFFGSGKSHLLKMLALLLENREIDGTRALDLFLPKCSDNEILRGDLKRAVAIPSKSILFNIDQKADVISKTQIDALLAVFVKVFDEMCGYYGKQGHIAQFERDLDSRGLYAGFQQAYREISGREWRKGREQALLESQSIAKAYAKVTGDPETSAVGILDKYRNQYRVSIEDFAEQVKAYVDSQSHGFRLNFFVDEVGQYIADNVKLMTNLQTVAESLATRCRGRAWVIVTAQEDMNTVVGEMSRQQSNDFSKIQARFANRMKLTSTDVAEVIQKRLLMKNEEGVRLLSDAYHLQANNFKTLFDFADGSQTYRNFQDRDHFIHCYPFIPYQFALFQSAIQNLSHHNAFEGKHSSVGERSMLGVFQQVAIHIGQRGLGQLATFDLMFEGIRTALKANMQRAILQSEKHLDSPFAIRVLKALFLVKYVKEFKSTIRNLCVLMLERFDQDLPLLRKNVEEALNLLEQQTYIQRNGAEFEYLTDEEKDIEDEIKNTEIDAADVAAELEKIVFDYVIKNRKIRYAETNQDYPYSRKLDDRLCGREYELAVNVITPFHEHADKDEMHRIDTVYRDELRAVLPADDRLMRDILLYKRTERYIKQNVTLAQQETVNRILSDKGFQNRERYAELQRRIQTLLGKAKLFVAGTEVDIAGEDAQVRVSRGFQELVARAYPNLRMLRGVVYSENDIAQCLDNSQESLFGDEAAALSEPEREVLAFVQGNNRSGVRTNLKSLVEKFERKPYGWHFAATLCTLAKLCAKGKIDVRSDSNLLQGSDLERSLRNSHGYGNVVLEPQEDFTPSQLRNLKAFYEEFFESLPESGEAKALARETISRMQDLSKQLSQLKTEEAQYPFLSNLSPALDKLKELTGKPYAWYLTELTSRKEELLDMKEAVIDPIRNFMRGPQKSIFDTASSFVHMQKSNFSYIEGVEAAELEGILAASDCFKGNRMQQIKLLADRLQTKVEAQLAAEIAKGKDIVAGLEARLRGMAEFDALLGEQQNQITMPFHEILASIEGQSLIAVIRDSLRRFEESDYRRLLSMLTEWAQFEQPSAPEPDGYATIDKASAKPPAKPATRVEYVPSRAVTVSFDKAWLADETDVDRYLASMRQALLEEIRKGKRIQI